MTDTAVTAAWYNKTAEEAFRELASSNSGLSRQEALRRLQERGPNELRPPKRVSPWTLLLEQFKNTLVIILLIAVALSAFLGHTLEAAAIAVIVLFAVGLGFAQEFRAEKAIEALRRMAAPSATVVRGGGELSVPAREVVPGDVILLRAGDQVPADARLLEAHNLQVDEASLTGESVPSEKSAARLDAPELAVGDRRNMVHAGTAASYGRGRALVTATGMGTEFGKIAQLLQGIDTGRTPLQENLDKVGGALARVAFAVVLLIVGLGLFRGQPFLEILIFGIALAVAVVPEALPAVVTISLAIGVQRMVRRHSLIRRLSAVETLGSTSVICSDKTGTLTRDEMTVKRVYAAGRLLEVSGAGYGPEGGFSAGGATVEPPALVLELLRAGALACDARLERGGEGAGWEVKGDPTEGALLAAASKAGLLKAALEARLPRIAEIPFSSETKRMTTLHSSPEGPVAFSKGALEVILASCSSAATESGEAPLDQAAREAILETGRRLAGDALRVLALARKSGAAIGDAEREMVFLGLVGMIDPPRPEAAEAVRVGAAAGIKVVMITGDHPLTAQAIARELGILKAGRVVTGAELEAMTDAELELAAENIEVYARVSPAHKLRVVTALQKNGHIVAMTGDGVNDAPALKKADIGIAMGITGTDVSKEAAAMTLTDDNFASIVAAVEEGRGVFGNIKKYLMYLLSSNIGEILLMLGVTLLGYPLPLTAVQILYVNLATDGLPALALAVDPFESDLMRRRPRNPRTGIFTRPVVALMVTGGVWSALVNLGLFSWALGSGRGVSEAMTMTFVSLVLIQFFKAYNFRSDRNSVLDRPFANRWLNLAVFWELVLLLLIIYVPFLNKTFGTYPLTARDWLIVGALSLTVSPVLELAKWAERRGWLGEMS